MPVPSVLESLYLFWFSKPAYLRPVYRAAHRRRVRTIVQLGMSADSRAPRLIQVARRNHPNGEVRYSGIDLFEARPEGAEGLKLKHAHRLLQGRGATVHLVPGDPLAALARTANSLVGTDLLILGADQDAKSLASAWFYVPRMLHERSLVLVESRDPSSGEPRYDELSRQKIDELATAAERPTRRAA